MKSIVFLILQQLAHVRTLLAIVVPLLGGAMAAASALLIPRGKAQGSLTGAYMLLTGLGAACLCVALAGAATGADLGLLVPALIPGIVLTVIMGIFTPEVIREYARFELRKLAAEIFRRS